MGVGHLESVRLLLQENAQVNVENKGGWTGRQVFFVLCINQWVVGHLESVRLLHVLRENAQVNVENEVGWTGRNRTM